MINFTNQRIRASKILILYVEYIFGTAQLHYMNNHVGNCNKSQGNYVMKSFTAERDFLIIRLEITQPLIFSASRFSCYSLYLS